MKASRIAQRLVSLVSLLAVLAIAACGSDGNPWCNENCSACPSSSSGTCVGRVGNQCCYCPANAWCADDLSECKCYQWQSDMAAPGTQLQSRASSPSVGGAVDGETLMCR
jgi:hypothetical protein